MARRYYGLAVVLVSLSVLGFVMPGRMFGLFETTPLLNAIHLAAGVLTGVAATRGLKTMRAWGQWLGYVFAGLSVAAFVADASSIGGALPLTSSNGWFHLLLALIYLYHALLAPPTL